MSIHVISAVMRKRRGSPSRKIVAIKLADVANEDATSIYPSISTVASEAELSERQFQRIMNEFRQAGVLVVVRPGGGRNRPIFDLAAVASLPDARSHAEEQIEPENTAAKNGNMVLPFPAETVTSATGNVDMGVTQPVLIRPITPYGEAEASREGGARPPSISSQIWSDGLNLLSPCAYSEPQKRSLIGKWQKRTPTELAKKDSLAALRAAGKAGTCHRRMNGMRWL